MTRTKQFCFFVIIYNVNDQIMNMINITEYIKTSSFEDARKLRRECDDMYYNTGMESKLTDSGYDELKEWLIESDPFESEVVGAVMREGDNRVSLPIHMRSMDKVTESHKLGLWVKRNEFDSGWGTQVKLDGVSCMAVYATDGTLSLFTRGDGETGADISYLGMCIQGLPTGPTNVAIRGELIMRRDVFDKKWKHKFANARNMVSGCVNAKTLKEGTSDIIFVAYEKIVYGRCDRPSAQLEWMADNGFQHVVAFKETTPPTITILKSRLEEMKSISLFEMDGVIAQPDTSYIHDDTRNPKRAIAFKARDDDNIAETEVVAVLWEETRWGSFKPRIEIKPVILSGVSVRFATAYNARYVVSSGLHTGAKVTITRSGDVIPHILKVVPHPLTPPDLPPGGGWKWNDSEVDIISTDDASSTKQIKMLSNFLAKLECKGVGPKIVEKLYNGGFETLVDILDATPIAFMKLDGFKQKLAVSTHESVVAAVKKSNIVVLLGASGVFGFGVGERKVALLLEGFPDLLTTTESTHSIRERISTIQGFSNETAIGIVNNLQPAIDLLAVLEPYRDDVPVEDSGTVGAGTGHVVVFSGFRDADLKASLLLRGYTVADTVTKRTTFVLVDGDDWTETSKTKKAQSYGIDIIPMNILDL